MQLNDANSNHSSNDTFKCKSIKLQLNNQQFHQEKTERRLHIESINFRKLENNCSISSILNSMFHCFFHENQMKYKSNVANKNLPKYK
ncbi:hypothetical protein BpHYR1_035342 [Brachionus plicatilis]|uniref:Uncharacterized protein n=1 Tax=Brachionus plicatilis TaxID=10195 RepID=A0A3M7PPP3_BRAPC|nr:hypothetical protein BpHYR1_035342 [Brachionus plicatilis]